MASDIGADRVSPDWLGRKGLPGEGNGISKGLEERGAKDGKLALSEMGSHWRLLNRGMARSFFLFKIIALLHAEEVAGGQVRHRETHEKTMALIY